jgi:RNA polymerase sigma-70 factor (ECF subfamily)
METFSAVSTRTGVAPTVTDSAIIRRSLSDPAAFGEIFDRHFVRIHGYLARRAGTQTADDLAGETFAVAFAARERYDLAYESAAPWLFGIATNVLRGNRRAWTRATRMLEHLPVPVEEPSEDRSMESMDATRRAGTLGPLFHRLSEQDTATLLLYAWEDLTYEEVATALGIPVGTVRSRLNRVRRMAAELGLADDTRGDAQ